MPDWEITPDLPRLHLRAPECDHCGGEVELDGESAWCDPCLVEWSRIEDGWVSTPDRDREGANVPCEIVPRSTGQLVYGPCILPSGHEGDHLTPYSRRPGLRRIPATHKPTNQEENRDEH